VPNGGIANSQIPKTLRELPYSFKTEFFLGSEKAFWFFLVLPDGEGRQRPPNRAYFSKRFVFVLRLRFCISVLFFVNFSFELLAKETNTSFSKEEVGFNFFRAPSIGGEYRRDQFSVHAGYYPTNFESGVTTSFYKVGVGYWFLPRVLFESADHPSSFYTYFSYGRGLNLNYENKDAFMYELGYRFMLWRGLSFRFGAIGLFAEGESAKLNPTPSIGYSVFF